MKYKSLVNRIKKANQSLNAMMICFELDSFSTDQLRELQSELASKGLTYHEVTRRLNAMQLEAQ